MNRVRALNAEWQSVRMGGQIRIEIFNEEACGKWLPNCLHYEIHYSETSTHIQTQILDEEKEIVVLINNQIC